MLLLENPTTAQLPSGGPTVSVPPTLVRFPADAVDFTRSQLTLEFAAEAGFRLDDWQAWAVWWSQARRADGDLASKHVYGEVPRQNGKNIWLEVCQITDLLLFGYRLFRHSAYRADTAHEHFLSLKEHILDSALLREYVKPKGNQGFFSANGKESIEFANGARILFQTRQKEGGRGPRPQKLYFDEALILDPEMVDSQVPSITAQRGSQVFWTTSAPMKDSEYVHAMRARAATDDSDDNRYFAVMWNNPAEVAGREIDPEDPLLICRVNPSMGQGRMTVESVLLNRRVMTLEGFIREHLGVPQDPPDVVGGPFSLEQWDTLAEETSRAVTHRTVALGVSLDRQWATIGVAGRRDDGNYHVEWKVRKPGTGWVVEEAVKLVRAGYRLRVHSTGPEATLLPKIREAFAACVDSDGDPDPIDPDNLVEVSTADFGRATDTMIDLVTQQTLRHRGQKTLADQVSVGRYRLSTEGVHTWSATRSEGPIDALKAVTIALGGAYEPEPETDDEFFVH